MSIREHIDTLAELAEAADGAMMALQNRPVVGIEDCALVTAAFLKRSRYVAARDASHVIDDAFDERIAVEATAAAVWRRCGGTRFVLSDSVAACFALTKRPPGRIALPFPAFTIEIPKGYMPSQIVGDFGGVILVAHTPSRIVCHSFVERESSGGKSGGKLLSFDHDADEDTSPTMLDERFATARPISAEAKTAEHGASMIIRFIRNLVAWLEAFPVRSAHGKKRRAGDVGVGDSIKDGALIRLSTAVRMDVGMRQAARSMLQGAADFKAAKLAIRHIVRGHWKRQPISGGHKTIFVAPYWRGPDGPAAWDRVYRVRDASTVPAPPPPTPTS